MSWRTRRRLALLALVLGLPTYIIVAVNVVALFERPGVWVELLVYLILGVIWVVPLRRLFLGIGRPPAEEDGDRGGRPGGGGAE